MRTLFRFILAAAALFAGGCASSPSANTVQVPRAPAFRSPANTAPVPFYVLGAELEKVLPGVPLHYSDNQYVIVNHEWLEEFVKWTWSAQMALGFTYVHNARDCDKFALATFLAATNSAANAHVEATPLVARIVVEQEHEFAGVPGQAGSRHELNAVYTDRAPHYWVLEPQPGGVTRLVPLDKYPHKILSVVLGDLNPGLLP